MTATPFSLDDALHSIYEVAGCSARLAAIQEAEQPIRAEFTRLRARVEELEGKTWPGKRGYLVDDSPSCLSWAGLPEQVVRRDNDYRLILSLTPA